VLDLAEMRQLAEDYVAVTRRLHRLGIELLEMHSAHGYLLHNFLSPLTNRRTDAYGGTLENRMRFPLEVFKAVREAWPAHKPLGARISAVIGPKADGRSRRAWRTRKRCKALGCDYITASSGGAVAEQKVEVGPGYQVPFADVIRRETGLCTVAVGLITEARQAEEILQSGKADLVGSRARCCTTLAGRGTPRSSSARNSIIRSSTSARIRRCKAATFSAPPAPRDRRPLLYPSSRGLRMAFETILTQTEGAAFVITMNRPAKRNAMSIKMTKEIAEACRMAEADAAVRGVIITGGPEFFSAGADLNEAQAIKSFVDAFNHMKTWEALTETIEQLQKPVIAAVEGFCITGGWELAWRATSASPAKARASC
jgi:hypothetical protein